MEKNKRNSKSKEDKHTKPHKGEKGSVKDLTAPTEITFKWLEDCVRDFVDDADHTELKFPAALSNEHRKHVHKLSTRNGMTSQSAGAGSQRYISLIKTDDTKAKERKQKSIDKIPHGASEILYDFLYLGSGRDANDKEQLRELGITRVLNVAREWRMPDSDDEDEGFDVKNTQLQHVIDATAEGNNNNNNAVNQAIKEDEALFEKKDAQSNELLDNDGHLHQKLEEMTLVKQGEKIVYKKLHLVDVVDEDVTSIFNEAFEFLEQCREAGRRVLVHCVIGKSRSASIVIAYLMKHNQMALQKAFNFVKSKRALIQPNNGFMIQLREYEQKLFNTGPSMNEGDWEVIIPPAKKNKAQAKPQRDIPEAEVTAAVDKFVKKVLSESRLQEIADKGCNGKLVKSNTGKFLNQMHETVALLINNNADMESGLKEVDLTVRSKAVDKRLTDYARQWFNSQCK
jgi:protein-tyrosine phosphatase